MQFKRSSGYFQYFQIKVNKIILLPSESLPRAIRNIRLHRLLVIIFIEEGGTGLSCLCNSTSAGEGTVTMEANWRSTSEPAKGLVFHAGPHHPTAGEEEKEVTPEWAQVVLIADKHVIPVEAVLPSGFMTSGVRLSSWGRRGGTWHLLRGS